MKIQTVAEYDAAMMELQEILITEETPENLKREAELETALDEYENANYGDDTDEDEDY